MNIDIKPSERLLLMGKTGGGKTEWAKFALRRIARVMPVVIIDPKFFWMGEEPRWAKRKEPGTIDCPHLVREFNPHYWVQCIQPDEYDGTLEKFLRDVIKRRYIYAYFDESDGIATATSVPTWIRRVWRWGRALHVGAAAGSQTYSGIPRVFKTQSEKRILFQVGEEDAEDAAKLVHVTKEEVLDLEPFEYIYYDTTSMQHGLWMPPIDLQKEIIAA